MNFKKLRNLRERAGKSQSEMAKIIGVSQQTYSLWEIGIKIIPLKHLNSLCDYYDVSMDYALGLEHKNNKTLTSPLDRKFIGLNIKKVRGDNSLTLRELAKILGTTSSTISAYETGKTLILTAFAYEICLRYKLSMDWLVGRKNEL